jgi:ribonuclease BN (tRNA processing enzyme)
MPNRRDTLFSLAATLCVPALPGAVKAAAPAGTRVVLLGTKGGPTPSPYRAAPATLIEIGGQAWLIDCGNGVGAQLAKAGIPLGRLAQIFITHNHSDHVIDLGTLLVLAWGTGLDHPVGVHGPPPLKRILEHAIAASAYDIEARRREEGRGPIEPLIQAEELTNGGLVLRSAGITVTCALVDHYSVKPAFAYRFDTPGRSIVISGDTAYSEKLVALARGADLLIHEAIYPPAIDRLAKADQPQLRDHLIRSHTTPEQAGRVAARAGVKKLVLSHLVPASPDVTDEMWLSEVRKSFAGEAVVGRDLMEV